MGAFKLASGTGCHLLVTNAMIGRLFRGAYEEGPVRRVDVGSFHYVLFWVDPVVLPTVFPNVGYIRRGSSRGAGLYQAYVLTVVDARVCP